MSLATKKQSQGPVKKVYFPSSEIGLKEKQYKTKQIVRKEKKIKL